MTSVWCFCPDEKHRENLTALLNRSSGQVIATPVAVINAHVLIGRIRANTALLCSFLIRKSFACV